VNNSNQARTNGLEENQWNDECDENNRIVQPFGKVASASFIYNTSAHNYFCCITIH
jgi:hypothetical protein